MNVDDGEKHRPAVRMNIADEPTIVDVAHEALDGIEGKVGARCVLRGQYDPRGDHDYEHDPGQRTVVPPVAEVARGRVFVELVVKELDERQPVIDPANDPGCGTGAVVGHGALLADGYRSVAGEFVERLARLVGIPRQPQVERCRALADPSRSVVDRAMAGAEPPAIGAAVVAGLLAERDAAEMGADPDDDQPFRLLDAVRILLRIAQLRDVDVFGGLDLLRGAAGDKDRFAAPGDGQALADLDRCEIDLGAGERQCVARRVERVDKRPDRRDHPDAADRTGSQIEEVAPCFVRVRPTNVLLCYVGHSQTSYPGGRRSGADRRRKLYR